MVKVGAAPPGHLVPVGHTTEAEQPLVISRTTYLALPDAGTLEKENVVEPATVCVQVSLRFRFIAPADVAVDRPSVAVYLLTPFRVVVDVPPVAPMFTLVVEPVVPEVPMFTVFMPAVLAALEILNVDEAVVLVLPNVVLVEAPKAFTLAMFVLNRVSVPVELDASVGLAPFMFRVVALDSVTVALPMVAVPVEAPRAKVVAAPAKFTVVAVVFNSDTTVWFV